VASISLPSLFDDLVRCETRLYNALSDRLRSEHDLGLGQYEFLHHIGAHPGTRVADLAAAHAVGIGATSKAVDRYERHGWVRREPNPDDRRSSLLTLTATGAELVARAERTLSAHLAELVGPAVDEAQLRVMAQALGGLRTALERDRVGLPTG
jgi:MarR family transcriptional regulator, multiple antibiotic resistance protein MarR